MNILVKGDKLRVECNTVWNSALWSHVLEQVEKVKTVKEITLEEGKDGCL